MSEDASQANPYTQDALVALVLLANGGAKVLRLNINCPRSGYLLCVWTAHGVSLAQQLPGEEEGSHCWSRAV